MKKLTRNDAVKVLKKIHDPELQIDIHTLGLIYEIILKPGNKLDIKMTFTTPACPYGPALLAETKSKLEMTGFKPNIEITFDPPWQPNEDIKMMLGLT